MPWHFSYFFKKLFLRPEKQFPDALRKIEKHEAIRKVRCCRYRQKRLIKASRLHHRLKKNSADRQPILEISAMYSGVYGKFSINFYAFNCNENKGIACGINNLQKIRDGELLGGMSRAEDDLASEEEKDFLS